MEKNKHMKKLFKDTNLNFTYKKIIPLKKSQRKNKISNIQNKYVYKKSEVCHLTYPDCSKKYIGQTDGSSKLDLMNMLNIFEIEVIIKVLPDTFTCRSKL
jgi:hypothetical protein